MQQLLYKVQHFLKQKEQIVSNIKISGQKLQIPDSNNATNGDMTINDD